MSPEELRADKDFMSATPADQHAYLIDTDPEYAKAAHSDQRAYLNHVRGDTLAPQTDPTITGILWDELKKTPGRMVDDTKSLASSVYNQFADPNSELRNPRMSTVLPMVAPGGPAVKPVVGAATRLGSIALGSVLDNPSTSPMEDVATAAKSVLGDPSQPSTVYLSPAAMEIAGPVAGKVLRSLPGARGRIASSEAEKVGRAGQAASPGLRPGTTVQDLRQAALEAPDRLGAAKEQAVQQIDAALNAVPGQTPHFTNSQGQQFVRLPDGGWGAARQRGEIPVPSQGPGTNMTLRAANDELSSIGDQMRGGGSR